MCFVYINIQSCNKNHLKPTKSSKIVNIFKFLSVNIYFLVESFFFFALKVLLHHKLEEKI